MAAPISTDVEAFLRQPHVAALATVRPDGWPHVTPVWYDFDGKDFTIATFRNAQKLTNVSRKGFAALSIFTSEPPYRNVIVEGTARVGEPAGQRLAGEAGGALPGGARRTRLRPGDRGLGRDRHPHPSPALDVQRPFGQLEGAKR